MLNAVLYHDLTPTGSGRNMPAFKNVFRTQQSKYLQALEEAKPGDGVGYPNEYTGERLRINNAFLKQCRLLRPQSRAFRLNSQIVIKTGDRARLSEAAAMRLLAEKTSIPIPKVHDAYVQKDGCGVIIMEHIDGITLDQAWPHYDHAQKQSVLTQLKSYMMELRSITSNVISSIDGEPCCDQFFATDSLQYGPYSDQDAFNEGLVFVLGHRGDHPWFRMISRLIRSIRSNDIVLTHNDLSPSNILVRDGMVVGILDWEMCGFYPDYWEYVKAYLFADWNAPWIVDKIPDKILTPKLSELSYLLHARDFMWPNI
ncbi:Putative aminoglycoside phosphotransferase, protein kinase-like domain superfamily [Septoria linicola]|uniref:Aminoglycoside phosphotransferase, protein kinase-like domain superfamily n=1 Tax=Septoria linicola TaxID=215465 RepID=A0A9Q9EK81_9PEZI|nr:putative aminoglycoside phosphotransferase, protein kinase-like domain superfamily [Septoria linicola]USW52128.1 Putative aminoglycoside phosphotransferase, protein kinase-like domain superfamily [Septoria linicola]